ncbi:deoxynucleoside triphosphate triphosphohydrolase [Skeletonema marinoi]|uniref:Deoxynucleoside triphosphate triphosphohydrolase n=1 Tax=Skeletonema marinoi TaxID=267567 RepID=A0AAD9D8V2_9STRA|nr:deoxynucleoside triphosphate triphosphohydrolase [Skeletonema marinoi]
MTSSHTPVGFEVWPMKNETRKCNDEVHGEVTIPPAVQIVLDSPAVQRLANLKQLGCAFNTYPSCSHTRKEHSLGVMETASNIIATSNIGKQQLNITKMDILCLRIAGLTHDLGHGPFSHVYESFLKASYKQEKEHPELYSERNAKFKEQFGMDLPDLPPSYEHEKTSLMMVDDLLATNGLEIDWGALDEPLKQVGNGVDSETFGVIRKNKNEPGETTVDHFTSRDWIFIKECIYGKPLVYPDAPETQKAFVGRGKNKEFLYDIISNRHSGLDVDRYDYYARDGLSAMGKKDAYNVLLRTAVVAKGLCPNRDTCFDCKDKPHSEEARHLMICYPVKHISEAMSFFETRINNHDKIYTHKKTKAAELLMVDLMLESDLHFSTLLSTQHNDPDALPTHSRFADFEYPKLPLSRAWMYPRLFLRADDSIVGVIEDKVLESSDKGLASLKKILRHLRKHEFYKCVGEVEIDEIGGDTLWDMDEDDIKREMVTILLETEGNRIARTNATYEFGDDEQITLDTNDIIVEKRELHYGSKEKNPVLQMNFLEKKHFEDIDTLPIEKLPLAGPPEKLPLNKPEHFIKRTIRFFSRDREKNELLGHAFQNWKIVKEEGYNELKMCFEEIDDEGESQSNPALLTQESASYSAVKRRKLDF